MSTQQAKIDAIEADVVSAENPWPGLLSFREADRRWFQGRREETAELLQQIKRERLTVLFALSGIGKSSLLQAGLFPALRNENIFPVYIRLDHATHAADLRAQVYDAMAQAGAENGVKAPISRGETLWEYFHNIDNEFWGPGTRRVLPCLVFDQFEEIFTLGREESRLRASEAFLEELADLAEEDPPAAVARRFAENPFEQDHYTDEGEYKLLISMREDFLAEFSDQRRRIASVAQKRYRLRQMNGEGALLAVSQAKDLVDETVARQIVRYIAGERFGAGRGRELKDVDVEPALLSVVCRELNNRRRERGEPRITADLLEGSQEQVLTEFYNRALEGMEPAVRAFVEEQLITVAGARNSVAIEDALAAPGMSVAVIETLVDRRLLRREYRRNEVRIELTHDLLTGVVAASRSERRQRETDERLRREAQETRAKLARSRRVAFGFATIAGLAIALAFVAWQQRSTALAATAAEKRQREIADQESVRASQQAALAKTEQQRAQEAAAEAARNAEEARVSAEKEAEAARIAEQRRREADQANQTAQQRRLEAERSRRAAEEAQAKEATARTQAEQANAKLNTANRDLESNATQIKQQRDQIQVNLAKSMVSEAVGFVGTHQPLRALGDVARALTLDPDSLGAKSLAFDQLLRGAWRQPVNPSQPGARQFVRAPLTHPDGVLFAAFSPDGRHIATASKDNKIRVWDWQAGTSVELGSHALQPTFVAFSPDGRHLVSASYDQTARVWDVAARRQTLELKHTKRVISAVFSRDGRRIVTASLDQTAQVWDAQSGARVGNPLTHPRTVNFAAFNGDSSRVVTACADGQARVWDVAAGRELYHVAHQRELKSAMFSPDGTRLVTASIDGTARIWAANTGDHLLVGDPMQHNGAVYFAVFTADNRRVATASLDNSARIWEASSGRAITAPLEHKAPVLAVGFAPDGNRVVTASDDKTAQVWDVWHNFESTPDLIRLLEAVSGFDGAQDNIPQLPEGERSRRLSELRTKANQQAATSFLRWFFAHRQ